MSPDIDHTVDLGSWTWGIESTPLPASHVLFIDEAGEYTVSEFLASAGGYAAAFTTLGLTGGQRVVCAATTSVRWMIAIAGLWRIGCVPVITRSTASRQSLLEIAESCGAIGLLTCCDERFAVELLSDAEVLTEITPIDAHDNAPRSTQSASTEVFGQTTSGSTGTPKVVMHRMSGLRGFQVAVPRLYGAHAYAVLITSADLSFGYGFGNSLLLPFLTGTRVVIPSPRSGADELARLIDVHQVTIAALSPRILERVSRLLADTTLTELRTVVSAGESLAHVTRHAVESSLGVRVLDGYGGTEFLHIVASRYAHADPFTAVEGMSLSVIDSDSNGVGVLRVDGPMACAEYLVAAADDHSRFDGTGFVTADSGRSVGGGVDVLGRVDDQINRGGVLFSPVTTESAARQLCPELGFTLSEVVNRANDQPKLVLGVAGLDEQLPLGGVRAIRRRLRDAVPAHAMPDTLVRFPRQPMTDTGKPDRNRSRHWAARRIGTDIRWRDLKITGSKPKVVIVPCAGSSPDMYADFVAALPGDVAGLDIDLRLWNDVEALARTVDDFLSSELAVGDAVFAHSLGATIVGGVLARSEHDYSRTPMVLFAPAVDLPTNDQVAALTTQAVDALCVGADAQHRNRVGLRVQQAHVHAHRLLHAVPGDWHPHLPQHGAAHTWMFAGSDVLSLGPARPSENVETLEWADHFAPITSGARIADAVVKTLNRVQVRSNHDGYP